ncbi:MAG: copper resistance protein NlpE [Bacteroidales bacterium]|nr:copper resistance protein NlpE [Bacteroidales bacterium]
MKRFSVILFVAFVACVCSCHRSQNTPNTSNPTSFHGTYLGILPCADCSGIETEIVLHKDNTYVKKTRYLGKGDDQKMEETGTYKWNKSENEIILNGITDEPNKYFVEEGAIVQADMDGERITGELSMYCILRKR